MKFISNPNYNFFTALPDYTAAVLRAKVDGEPMPVIAPPLTINSANGQNLVLSWPVAAAGFTVQLNRSLNPTNCTTCTATRTTNGDNVNMVIATTNSAEFFRLMHI